MSVIPNYDTADVHRQSFHVCYSDLSRRRSEESPELQQATRRAYTSRAFQEFWIQTTRSYLNLVLDVKAVGLSSGLAREERGV